MAALRQSSLVPDGQQHLENVGIHVEQALFPGLGIGVPEIAEVVVVQHDVIVVDSAPVLAVSDTLFLCPEVDSVLFVVLAGITPRKVALRAKEILVDSGAAIAGMVVNNALQVLPYYYDYKYYGYAEDSQKGSSKKRD